MSEMGRWGGEGLWVCLSDLEEPKGCGYQTREHKSSVRQGLTPEKAIDSQYRESNLTETYTNIH